MGAGAQSRPSAVVPTKKLTLDTQRTQEEGKKDKDDQISPISKDAKKKFLFSSVMSLPKRRFSLSGPSKPFLPNQMSKMNIESLLGEFSTIMMTLAHY